MLLSHCPNCQHDNPPGERFCAACGVPLDLKPCPVCGKVDNIKATVCSGCGAHFPPLPGGFSPEQSSAPAASSVRKPIPPVVAPPSSTIRAFPLIVIALAAGGIPLLWLFRNVMPVPKAWQAPAPSIEVPATTLPPAQTDLAPAPAPALIPLPPKSIQQPIVDAAPPPAPAADAPTKPPVAARPVAPVKPAAKPVIKAAPKPDATKPAGPECTEALAAVGLCDPKAGK